MTVTLSRLATRFVAIRAEVNETPVQPLQYALSTLEGIPVESDWQDVVTRGPDVGWYQQPTVTGPFPVKWQVWARWGVGPEFPYEKVDRLTIE